MGAQHNNRAWAEFEGRSAPSHATGHMPVSMALFCLW